MERYFNKTMSCVHTVWNAKKKRNLLWNSCPFVITVTPLSFFYLSLIVVCLMASNLASGVVFHSGMEFLRGLLTALLDGARHSSVHVWDIES